MTGRPSRINVHRDWPLDKHQEQVAAEFILEPPPRSTEQRAYEAGWRNSLAYEELESRQIRDDERARREHVRALRRLSHKIVPASRQAAAPSRLEIHRAALRCLRECGGTENFNISAFVKEVQSQPSAWRVYRNSTKSKPLSDHAIRAILKGRLGIGGKPGRKPKKA